MKADNYWRTIFKTPSHARTATLVMMAMWVIAAIWGWFFVEPTVLRDSQSARDYVDWATKVFPWLENIRKLVPQAEKGLYLHCVYTVVLAPFSMTYGWTSEKAYRLSKTANNLTSSRLLILILSYLVGLMFLIFVIYNYLLQPSFGNLHRTGYSLVVNSFTVPILAPLIIMGIWIGFICGIYAAYLLIRQITESNHG